MIGRTLGHYRVVEKLGAGGMGEVYRAADTKLGRDVALKVLPESFARDPERLARFEREARVLAQLNHPNIAAIHGFENIDSVPFLVLEYVPGETLQGPLPVDEALGIVRQIVDALEEAHEKGFVHRDLKPANIKVTPEGKVKVLDFGLAKAFADERPRADPSQSPTVSIGGTRAGVILGTASYMSPEQARGKPLDKRTDIWSFGCVLYEMLAGEVAFRGETMTDIIMAVAGREPDWDALPAATPGSVRDLLRRCLEKDSRRRLRDIGDARPQLEATAGSASAPPRVAASRLPWMAGAVAGAILAGVAAWTLKPQSAAAPQPVKRFAVALSPGDVFTVSQGPALAFSPDGSRLVYVASRGGKRQLFLRAMDQLEAVPIRGAEEAVSPFFSPDGQWVAFYAYPKLKKISVSGGTPVVLADAGGFRGGAWLPDDTIIYAPTNNSGLYRIPASITTGQAKPEVFTKLDVAKGERGHRWPVALPGGKAVMFSVMVGRSFGGDDAQIVAQTLDGGERRMLVQGAAQALFAPASPGATAGYLVYASRAGLLAAPFDAARLELRGTASSVLDGVMLNLTYGIGHFSVSGDSSLVYLAGGAQEASRRLVWVDRKGLARPVAEKTGYFHDPRLSPDGKRLAVNLFEGRNDLWMYDLEREALSRLTFEADNHWHAWSPDGKRIAFGSDKGGAMNLYWKPADGSGPEERLTTSENVQIVTAWSPDGRTLAFTERNPTSGSDLHVLPLEGDRKPQPMLKTPFNEGGAVFSPDGRWIAYWSDQTGRPEIYVQPFPDPGGKWQVSTDGGVEPLWVAGGELFYRNGDKMMVVEVQTKPSFAASKPRVLFEGRYTLSPGLIPYYDVTRDGQHFVMVKDDEMHTATPIRVVVNWVEELRRKTSGRAQ